MPDSNIAKKWRLNRLHLVGAIYCGWHYSLRPVLINSRWFVLLCRPHSLRPKRSVSSCWRATSVLWSFHIIRLHPHLSTKLSPNAASTKTVQTSFSPFVGLREFLVNHTANHSLRSKPTATRLSIKPPTVELLQHVFCLHTHLAVGSVVFPDCIGYCCV